MSKHIFYKNYSSYYLAVKKLVVMALSGAVLGCSLAPTYERPVITIAKHYPKGEAYQQTAQSDTSLYYLADIDRREFFKDPLLQQLIDSARANNHDLKIAAMNVEALEAQYRIRRSERLPKLNMGIDATVQKLPSEMAYNRRAYQLGLSSIAWELDLWGRLRNLSDQALQNYLAAEETQIAVQMSLVSAVARTFLTYRANQGLLNLSRATVKVQQQSYDLTKALVQNGSATNFDLSLVEMALRSAQADQSRFLRSVAQDRNALILLMGAPLPESLSLQLDQLNPLPDQMLSQHISAGLPSDLLIRRPDIRGAEHKLQASNANIGVARAAFFPSIQLTGSVGTASSSLDNLFSAGTGMWTFTPKITLPIFNAGANKANLERAQVLKRIEIVNYNKVIQTAFREVSDHLASKATLDEQIKAQKQNVVASENAYRLAKLRFKAGVDNYFVVLDLEKTLYASQQQFIQMHLEQLNNDINLYKALGGGWSDRHVR